MDTQDNGRNGTTEVELAGISIRDVRAELTHLVNRAAYAGERIPITKNGKVVAFIVSPDDVARLTGESAG